MYVTCTKTGERFSIYSKSPADEADDNILLYMEDKTLIGKLFASEYDFKDKQAQYEKLSKHPDSKLYISMPVRTVEWEDNDDKMFGYLFRRLDCDLDTLAGKRDHNFLLPLFVKIAKAINFLHTEINICHGDLSARNVIFGANNNEVLLIDITSNLSEYDPYSEPPEQLMLTLKKQEESRTVYGKERDIWCFGLLIYHMVTGHHLFNYPHISSGSSTSSTLSNYYQYNEEDDDIYRALDQINVISKYFKLPPNVNLEIETTRKDRRKKVTEMFIAKSTDELAKLVFSQLCHTDYNVRPTSSTLVVLLESIKLAG